MQLGTFGRSSAPVEIKFPELPINHRIARFTLPRVENATDTELNPTRIDVIILGQLRSRVMWPGPFGSKQPPSCKSEDSIVGLPTPTFPWNESEFADVPSNRAGLKCEDCKFKEWDKEFGRKRCQETWTIPIRLVKDNAVDPQIRLLLFKSSGITELKEYFRPMISKGEHPFNYITRIKLRGVTKDGNRWAKPEFIEISRSNPALHQEFVDGLRSVKDHFVPPSQGNPIKPLGFAI